VIPNIEADARRWAFFQLVRRITRARTDAVAPGGPGPAALENVRFRPAASLGFPATDVDQVEALEGEPKRYRVTVNFMGLYGPASPLPNHFTEEILWAGAEGAAVRDFLDVFHHRIISLLYRAWEKYRYPEQFMAATPDPVTRRMLALLGLGTPGMGRAAGLDLPPLLRTAGALSSRRRSAIGLERFIASHLEGVEVRVEPCIRRRVRIAAHERIRLGRSRSRLGVETCLGELVSDRGGAFRIHLGPLGLARYRSLLPGSADLARLVRLTRLYARSPLGFDVRLRLRAREVPALKLDPAAGLGLGYMSWLAPRGTEEGRTVLAVQRLDPLAPTVPGRR
jgi:type VI secretion system protein ImpH